MPNEIKLQEGHPVDENIRPLKVGGKATAIELAQHGNGAKVTGDLEVNGDLEITGNVIGVLKATTIQNDGLFLITATGAAGDIHLNPIGANLYIGDHKNDGYTIELDTGTNTLVTSLKFYYILDKTDYMQLSVGNNGATTLATVNGIGIAAHLTLDADGDILLDADGGNIKFQDNGVTYIDFQVDGTNDKMAVEGALTIDTSGAITLDSATGEFIAKNAGTEFSAANSAYAGMILGYSMIRNEQDYTGTNQSDAIITLNQTSFTLIESAEGTKAGVTFIAPPSEKVEVEFDAFMSGASTRLNFGLSTSDSSYTEVADLHDYNNFTWLFDETDSHTINVKWVVEGLTAGTSYTYYVWYKAISGSAYIYHGEAYHHGEAWHSPPVITKVTALPSAFSITGD